MAVNVTNQQILDALRLLGIGNVGGAIDLTGAQNSAFRGRLSQAHGVSTEQFDQAKAVARGLAEERYDPNAPYDPGLYNFEEALHRRGVTKEQRDAARAIAAQTLGKRPGDEIPANVFARALASAGVRREVIDSALGFARIPGPAGTGGVATVASLEEQLGRIGPGAGPAPGGPSVGPRGAPGRAKGVPGAPSPAVGAQAVSGSGAGDGTPSPTGGPTGTGTPARPPTPAEARAIVESRYGWAAALSDIPDVATVINDYVAGNISLDEVDRRFKSTTYFKNTVQAERDWRVLERTSPAEAARTRQQRADLLRGVAQSQGVELSPGRFEQLVDLSTRYAWTDDDVARFLAAEFRYDPTGTRAGITAALKKQVRDFMVPLGDQALTAWGQSIINGTKTEADFSSYLRDSARSLFPALKGALDDPEVTVRTLLDPYGQIAEKVLGVNAATIDWTDGKWLRAVNTSDDKGNRTMMELSDWQRTLMSDSQYGFDQSANGKAAKADLSQELLKKFGFAA